MSTTRRRTEPPRRSTGTIWVDNDLTTPAGAVPPTATSALDGYPLSNDSQHVFFIGTDNHVHELYLTAGAGWVDIDLTALARAVPPTPTTALDGYPLSDTASTSTSSAPTTTSTSSTSPPARAGSTTTSRRLRSGSHCAQDVVDLATLDDRMTQHVEHPP